MKLFTYTTFISWIILGIIGKLISNYPNHVIITFTLIIALWIGLIEQQELNQFLKTYELSR